MEASVTGGGTMTATEKTALTWLVVSGIVVMAVAKSQIENQTAQS